MKLLKCLLLLLFVPAYAFAADDANGTYLQYLLLSTVAGLFFLPVAFFIDFIFRRDTKFLHLTFKFVFICFSLLAVLFVIGIVGLILQELGISL